eukprot:gb/GECH01014084.1/.p1 GENE.gb/GECH01014084.1/~~gb/GECH01014084.1/.p1  ORF type:complete len:162 (+),score=11.91 gb/GECH01014084.1/:1-486(+)
MPRSIGLGSQVHFDPILVILQIILIQCCFYLSWGFIMALFDFVKGFPISFDQFFSYKAMRLKSYLGWVTFATYIFSGIINSMWLYTFIQRSRKCLDFAVTMYVAHLVVCTFYRGLPMRIEWWIATIAACALMTIVGEFICMKRELKDIPVKPKDSEPRENV